MVASIRAELSCHLKVEEISSQPFRRPPQRSMGAEVGCCWAPLVAMELPTLAYLPRRAGRDRLAYDGLAGTIALARPSPPLAAPSPWAQTWRIAPTFSRARGAWWRPRPGRRDPPQKHRQAPQTSLPLESHCQDHPPRPHAGAAGSRPITSLRSCPRCL